ncbi:MAG TPA: deoxynucleotide monophosphate kinase [Xanthobacteraceae bacterium]|nr:deoxynucleotide monophosphate kinase [Xanthobacteraceae bacterium]
MKPIIAFSGLARSGKSTALNILVNKYGFTPIPLAAPLKRMLIALGLTEAQVYGDQKETPCELLCGKTPRWAMQTLGTEWGRDIIAPDLWTRAWESAAAKAGGFGVTCDDVRFPNEVAMIRKNGGIIIRIERNGAGLNDGHVSESMNIEFDYLIRNTGTLDSFAARVRAIADQHIFKEAA